MFVSAIWGQRDSISLVFVFAAFLAATQWGYGSLVVPSLLALAMVMKPQFGILAPILAAYLLITAIPEMERRPGSLAVVRSMLTSVWHQTGRHLFLGGGIAAVVVTVAGWPFHVNPLPLDG